MGRGAPRSVRRLLASVMPRAHQGHVGCRVILGRFRGSRTPLARTHHPPPQHVRDQPNRGTGAPSGSIRRGGGAAGRRFVGAVRIQVADTQNRAPSPLPAAARRRGNAPIWSVPGNRSVSRAKLARSKICRHLLRQPRSHGVPAHAVLVGTTPPAGQPDAGTQPGRRDQPVEAAGRQQGGDLPYSPPLLQAGCRRARRSPQGAFTSGSGSASGARDPNPPRPCPGRRRSRVRPCLTHRPCSSRRSQE